VEEQQNKNLKGDEEEETNDSVRGSLDKGKCLMQLTQGESEFEGPTLIIENLPTTMLST